MVMAKIKAGYKKTDIGVIPEDWDIKLVSDLCDIVSGGTPSTANPTFWIKGDIPWCIPSDITETSGKYLYKTDRNITSLGLSKSSANLLPEGSLLLCSRATIGEIKVAKTEITTNQGFKSLVCHSVDNEFMYYKVLTLKEQLLQLSTGSTFLEFSKKDISRLQIDVPKPKEQKAIAAALLDVDGLIESLEKLIAKKRDMKTATMQQLLTGKKRLSGFDGEWEEKVVNDFGEIITGSTPSTKISEYWGGTIPWVTPTDIEQKKDIATSERQISKVGLSVARKLQAGAVLVTCIASIGKNAILRKEGACNQQINAIIPNFKYCSEFIYYLMEINKDYLIANAGITATRIISKKDFSDIAFLLPELEEQKAIAQILSDMDAEIESLEKRLEKAHNLKIGMMQELLTGKTRLIKASKIQGDST